MLQPRDIANLRSTRRGDESAARSLYARHAPALTLYARAILRDDSLAEDAVQSALCRIFTTPLHTIDAVDDCRAWLVRVVRNESLNLLRARRRSAARETRVAQRARAALADSASKNECAPFFLPSPGAPAPDDADLQRALEALPRRLRETVVLKHVAELTFDQMALALGANRHTVAARHRAAMARLRDSLAPGARPPVPERGIAHA